MHNTSLIHSGLEVNRVHWLIDAGALITTFTVGVDLGSRHCLLEIVSDHTKKIHAALRRVEGMKKKE